MQTQCIVQREIFKRISKLSDIYKSNTLSQCILKQIYHIYENNPKLINYINKKVPYNA